VSWTPVDRRDRVKGGSACREAPRTLSPTVQSGAISFSGGWMKARSVEDGRRAAVEEAGRRRQREKDQEPRSAEGVSERSGNFLKLRLLNLISRCAGASAQKS